MDTLKAYLPTKTATPLRTSLAIRNSHLHPAQTQFLWPGLAIPSASWLDRQLKAPPSGLLRLVVQFDGPVLALSFGTLPTLK